MPFMGFLSSQTSDTLLLLLLLYYYLLPAIGQSPGGRSLLHLLHVIRLHGQPSAPLFKSGWGYMGSMQWQLGSEGTIPAFTLGPRETKKNLCRDGRSQDLPVPDLQPVNQLLIGTVCCPFYNQYRTYSMHMKQNINLGVEIHQIIRQLN